MKLTTAVIALCCGLVVFAACKKTEEPNNNNNNNNNNNTPTKKQLLEAGKWQMSAYTATANIGGKDTTADLYAEMDECDKDDFILFASNGTATMDENTNKCPNDQQIENATWALLENDTKLALMDSNPDTFDVDITATQFKLKVIEPSSGGTPVTWMQTFKNIK